MLCTVRVRASICVVRSGYSALEASLDPLNNFAHRFDSRLSAASLALRGSQTSALLVFWEGDAQHFRRQLLQLKVLLGHMHRVASCLRVMVHRVLLALFGSFHPAQWRWRMFLWMWLFFPLLLGLLNGQRFSARTH